MAIKGHDEVSRLVRSLIYQLFGASDRQHEHHSSERKGTHQALLEQDSRLMAKKPQPEFLSPLTSAPSSESPAALGRA